MSRTFTIEITPELAESATRHFLWRHFGWTGVTAVVAGLGLVTYFLTTSTFGWVGGALAATLLVFLALFVVAYFQRRRATLALLRKMEDPKVTYELTEETLTARTSLGSTTLRWSAFKGLWKFEKLWLLLIESNAYITLPLAGPDKDDLAFIESRIPRHDKPVK